MKKIVMIMALAGVLGFIATPAQANWLEFFFPSLKSRADDPLYTLRAPFADKPDNAQAQEKAQAPVQQDLKESLKLPENATPMDKPHRTASQIRDWVTMAVSEALTFSGGNFEAEIKEINAHFDNGGMQQYREFLAGSKIEETIRSGRYKMHSYVEAPPLLTNEGVVQGRYSWLFEVPVTLSYLDVNMTDYKKADAVNQSMTLRVQVARFTEAPNDAQVIIQRWVAEKR